MQMEDEDSDAGDFGLEASTAEFSAVDRQTPVHDMANQNEHTYDLPLQAESVKCDSCAEEQKCIILCNKSAQPTHS
jgi:hypothetical protein